MIRNFIGAFWLSLIFCSSATAEFNPAQKTARDSGIALFRQSDWYDSQPLLTIAAEAGDRDAQYYLGEAIRLSKRYITAEAKKWYEAAAEQGDLYAMLRLSKEDDLCTIMDSCSEKGAKDWREQVLKAANERAVKGDTEAMTVLFTAGQGISWLEKAAEGGDSYAQQLLASVYKSGAGWFFIPGSREKEINRLFKSSSEGGNPRGMFLYANYLYDHNGSKEEIAHWVKKAAENSHIDSLITYAYKISDPSNELGYPVNLKEAYSLILILSKLEAGTAPKDAKRKLPELESQMKPDEIKQGIEFSKEWKKTHPPLSYFDPIYGY
ncbi:tetratricopeptide repeat protein [Pseudomonas fitomaticsae]|uniref:Sel1 repeat family protein n=1 Tax=Pseudomonas fitomaticsae TaxID=2837969 RepID=A0ABY3Q584_9PSED|nr:sel1 repeat family protein [Pseudomonas fitomaticsae]UFQ01319.1 sel1 repeat family protein [Pseudomonas fitomaticsae]